MKVSNALLFGESLDCVYAHGSTKTRSKNVPLSLERYHEPNSLALSLIFSTTALKFKDMMSIFNISRWETFLMNLQSRTFHCLVPYARIFVALRQGHQYTVLKCMQKKKRRKKYAGMRQEIFEQRGR